MYKRTATMHLSVQDIDRDVTYAQMIGRYRRRRRDAFIPGECRFNTNITSNLRATPEELLCYLYAINGVPL